MAVEFNTFHNVAHPEGNVQSGLRVSPAARTNIALGELLVERDFITAEQLAVAIAQQRTSGRRLGHMLIDLGFTTPDAVLGALAVQLGVAATRLNGYTVNPAHLWAPPAGNADGEGGWG